MALHESNLLPRQDELLAIIVWNSKGTSLSGSLTCRHSSCRQRCALCQSQLQILGTQEKAEWGVAEPLRTHWFVWEGWGIASIDIRLMVQQSSSVARIECNSYERGKVWVQQQTWYFCYFERFEVSARVWCLCKRIAASDIDMLSNRTHSAPNSHPWGAYTVSLLKRQGQSQGLTFSKATVSWSCSINLSCTLRANPAKFALWGPKKTWDLGFLQHAVI